MTKVIVRTGGVCIYYKTDCVVDTLRPLMNRLTEIQFRKDWKTQSTVKEIKAKFFIHHPKHKMIQFHRAFINDAFELLRGHPNFHQFEVDYHEPIIGKPIDVKYTAAHKMPRKRQPEYIDFMTSRLSPVRVLPASPGSGKTLCTIYGMTVLKVKTAIALLPSLKDNWIKNLIELTDLEREDILYVNGGDGLYDYMTMVRDGLDNFKVVIFSINTMQDFINGYLEEDNTWIYTPDELFDEAEFGLKVVDEAHKWLHFHCLFDMFSNMALHHFLTGTLMNESPFLSKMEKSLFPEDDRCPVDPPTNHLHMVTYQYNFAEKPPGHIGAMGYNHMKFEGNIFKKKKQLDAYLRMMGSIFYTDFYKSFAPGDKALVFFSTVNMVKGFAELLQKVLPDIKVVTYLAGDDEEVFADADVIISTTKKAGTGTDIPGLTYVLQTIMISSIGENYQNCLRLREILDRKTQFTYVWSGSIHKHKDYHFKRLKDLKPLVCNVENRTLNVSI